MGHIAAAKAYANNEVAYIAWRLQSAIPGCLGFELTRIYPDTKEERVLPAWVPFTGQRNPHWLAQTTSVWPVQRLMWRDLTVRKRRDGMTRRPADVRVKYRIVPMVPAGQGVRPVPPDKIPTVTYEGDPVALDYADDGIETNTVLVTATHGAVRAAFTNGILSAQWLRQALAQLHEPLTQPTVLKHMRTKGDRLREYLTGDVLGMVTELLQRTGTTPGTEARLALYELSDEELKDTIVSHKSHLRLILSNTGQNATTKKWDGTNAPFRKELDQTLAHARMADRMFNNGHIGHNKFCVFVDATGSPAALMTGSTNWTPTGLCGQSNNAMIIESAPLAKAYLDFWQRIADDTAAFVRPDPLSAGTNNVQQPTLRTANKSPQKDVTLSDGSKVTLWCAPNTTATTMSATTAPPDLQAVFSLMRKAHDAILFAVFLPSRSGKHSIIEEAIALGQKDSSLLVYGAVSDPQAMPNYVAPTKSNAAANGAPKKKASSPTVYDNDNVHVVLASALTKGDLVGDFEAELLKAGQAIIHDKIVVVDPLSADGFVVMGSHNLGYKASYENDENLLIIRNNRSLIEAYAVHVLDLYDHYRFRAVEAAIAAGGATAKPASATDGFLSRDAHWLDQWMKPEKGGVARYFSG